MGACEAQDNESMAREVDTSVQFPNVCRNLDFEVLLGMTKVDRYRGRVIRLIVAGGGGKT